MRELPAERPEHSNQDQHHPDHEEGKLFLTEEKLGN